MKEKWFQKSYRHNAVDMHIPDWNKEFLSQFDPKIYVEMLSLSKVTTAIVYANSHVGHCYWPTKTGYMHKGLKGKDILGEIIDLCHQRGMNVIVYYSLIFNNWAYDNHPDWRIITSEGKEGSCWWPPRFLICCPNSPYRDFAVAQIEELCKNYEFEGMWFDMTFWTDVCYCSYCKKRYALEVGGKPPTIINWEDPKWVKFQRKREKWLAEFASLTTCAVKKLKPTATVTHQSVSFGTDWTFGASIELARQSDFLAADLHGNPSQLSFYFKLFSSLGENTPFEFFASRCYPNLTDHTSIKSKALLKAQIYLTLANNGAFVFIDAIDPVGTLNKDVYERMREIFEETKGYEKYLGGKLCQDVGIYLGLESRITLADNGKKVSEAPFNITKVPPHSQAALGAAKSLLNHHIPFGVITKKNLKDLSSYQVIILPNLIMIDEEEVEALKNFVSSGGSLYASKYTSLITKQGERGKDFLLSDVFGISYLGKTEETVTYISPKEKKELFPFYYSDRYPLAILSSQLKVKVKEKEKTKVIATLTLPYTNPKDPSIFASIHSNPPGIPTEYPSILLNQYGEGKALYVAVDLESVGHDTHRLIFANLIKMLCPKPLFLETDALKSVEIISFHQKDKKRYLINLLNFQAQLPNIPIEGIKLRVRLGGKEPKKLIKLPQEKELAYEVKKDYLEFISPKLETFLMIALDYK